MKKLKRAIFLDRDGTIINERGYLSDPKKIQFYRDSLRALKILAEKGYLLIIVTNQSGVGRGYFTLKQLAKVHQAFLRELRKKGIKIAAIYFCPHLPDAQCACRKPNPFFAFKARREFKLDLTRSFMIGDQIRDMRFALSAKINPVLLMTGAKKTKQERRMQGVIAVKKNLFFAAQWIPSA